MIARRIREWDRLRVIDDGPDEGAVSRARAKRLLGVAHSAGQRLRLGTSGGDRILADRGHYLQAGQVVGIIAAADVSLEILPKIDLADVRQTRDSLVYMLARVFDLPISDGALSKLTLQNYDLLEIIIRLFCDRLFQLVHRGLPRQYVAREDDLPALRNRLDVIRQFSRLAVSPQKLACRFEDLSPDIALNQVMKSVVKRLRGVSRTAENQRHLLDLEFVFSEVTDVSPELLPWSQVILDRTNHSWRDILGFAKLLLSGQFQTTSSGSAAGYSLLFEMNFLFEEFVGRALRSTLARRGIRVGLQRSGGYALSDQDGRGRFLTRPDIIVTDPSTRISWIVDTKWKRLEGAIDDPKHGIDQSDVYQMMAYAQVNRCKRVILLYPHHCGIGMPPGRIAEFVVSGGAESTLVVATVDLLNIQSVPAQLNAIIGTVTV